MKRYRPRAEDFTLGWICALPVELTAATEILDEEYESSDDTTQYTLGRIGRHNVVVICLPAGQIGTNAAAASATEMRGKFPSLHIGLMVGIGGGVPILEADIRLGDVVISQPQGTYGGVVQYDFGKTVSGGLHTRAGSLNAPPPRPPYHGIQAAIKSQRRAKQHLKVPIIGSSPPRICSSRRGSGHPLSLLVSSRRRDNMRSML